MADVEHVTNASDLLVTKLNHELLTTQSRARKRAEKWKHLKAEHDAAKAENDRLKAEIETLRAKVDATPGELQAENDRLKGEIRTRDHRAAWEKAIGADVLNDKVTIDKVWTEIGYAPGDEMPTPDQITERMKAAREAAPYLFKVGAATAPEAPDGGASRTRPAELSVATGASQGRPDMGVGGFRVTKQQLGDSRWMSNPHNRKALTEARKNGSLEIVG